MANGLKIPKGVNLEIPMHNIHMDEDFYPDAKLFNPFRFADPSTYSSTTAKSTINLSTSSGSATTTKPDSRTTTPRQLITLDDTFMTFGYGRNGCPGRFFGAHLMKAMLAYIIMNYDIEFMKERPKIVTLMEFRFPNEKTTVRIRRRRI
jgi:cytochrome P450